jgi:hypothetical protein
MDEGTAAKRPGGGQAVGGGWMMPQEKQRGASDVAT